MRMASFRLHNLARAWVRFVPARRGSVVITFALSLIPMLALVGAAVDYTRANSLRTSMQLALDATVLMMSKNAATQTSDQVQTSAQSYFGAAFNHPEVKNQTIAATYATSGGSQVAITGAGDVDTTFIAILGFKKIHITAAATAKWGSARLRVALVLDNTGSMLANGKIDALKTATKNLITQLQNAAHTPDDVYVSIVPFVKDVNVGAADYIPAWDSWIYWDNVAKTDTTSWDATHGICNKPGYSPRSSCIAQSVCSNPTYTSQSTCLAAGSCSLASYTTQSTCVAAGSCSITTKTTQSTCTGAGTCSNSGQTTQSNCTTIKACSNPLYTTQFNCQGHSATWATGAWTSGHWTVATWTATPGTWAVAVWTPDRTTWKGCLTDRGTTEDPHVSADYDQTVTVPTSATSATMFRPEDYSACPKAILGLNNDWAGLKTLVDSMTANGSTNQPIGLIWGWQSLVGGGPLTSPAKDLNFDYIDAIILLSDGLNTQNRWDGDGIHTSTRVDGRMYDSSGNGTCANINAANVTLYTIQVNTGGDPTSTLLQNCAGSPGVFPDSGKFYLLTSADQIITTFDAIGTGLTKLRIAQ